MDSTGFGTRPSGRSLPALVLDDQAEKEKGIREEKSRQVKESGKAELKIKKTAYEGLLQSDQLALSGLFPGTQIAPASSIPGGMRRLGLMG